MKPGQRALGVAESYARGAATSTLAGVVVRGDRVVDGVALNTCTVGGTDVTESASELVSRLGREDVRYVLVSGIALAWYNILDPEQLAATVDRPVIVVTYEASDGLEDALKSEFGGAKQADRLDRYRALPKRHRITVNGQPRFIRVAGIDPERATTIVRAYTPEGGRPEPLRVAQLVAHAVDQFRRRETTDA